MVIFSCNRDLGYVVERLDTHPGRQPRCLTHAKMEAERRTRTSWIRELELRLRAR